MPQLKRGLDAIYVFHLLAGWRMSQSRQFYQEPPTQDRRQHPEFGISEDRAQLLIARTLETSLAAHEREILHQMDSRFSQLEALFKSAFPDGDPDGHRRAHESEIKSAAGWQKIKTELISRVITAGAWGAIAWLFLVTIEAIKSEFRK